MYYLSDEWNECWGSWRQNPDQGSHICTPIFHIISLSISIIFSFNQFCLDSHYLCVPIIFLCKAIIFVSTPLKFFSRSDSRFLRYSVPLLTRDNFLNFHTVHYISKDSWGQLWGHFIGAYHDPIFALPSFTTHIYIRIISVCIFIVFVCIPNIFVCIPVIFVFLRITFV